MAPNKTLIIISSITGYLTMALGLCVVVGWYLKLPALIQVFPTLAPLQFNTALSFIGLGGALVLLNCRQNFLACLVALVPLLFGFLTEVEYLFRIDLGIDQLFMTPYIVVNTSNPGRIPPNSAMCFILLGTSVFLASVLKTRLNKIWLSGALASISFALGSVAFIGYLFDIKQAYGWMQLTHMSLHASLGFTVISLGVYLNVVQGIRKNISRISMIFAVLITIFFTEVLLWQPLRVIKDLGPSLRFVVFIALIGLLLSFAIYLARDILRLSITLEEAFHNAEKNNNEKDVLLRHISHEIRNPLNAAIGLLDLYVEEHKVDESLSRIYASCHHILHVVENLLSITRKEGDGLVVRNVSFAFGEWAKSVESICNVLAIPYEIKFTFMLKGDPLLILEGDETKLSQIVFNLVDNAFKYTRRGAVTVELDLEIQSAQTLLSIRVIDTGIGIPPDKQEKVFKFFGRTSEEHRIMGAGYGLAICKAYTELMGGKIFFTSVAGQGSIFTVQVMLPLKQSQAA